jgi:hypothetical protein
MFRKHLFGVGMAVCLAMVMMASPAKAVLTIDNILDHHATYEDSGLRQGSISAWTIGSGATAINHAMDLSFYYRLGPSGPEQKLVFGGATASGDTLNLTYSSSFFDVFVEARLLPSGVGKSNLLITPQVVNRGSLPINGFHLFEYVDLDLTASPGDDFAQRTAFNTIRQTDSSTLGAEVVTEASQFLRGAGVGAMSTILGALTNGVADDFTGSVGDSASGNVAFVFQWDINLASAGSPGDTYSTSNLHQLAPNPIPEPVSTTLCLLGLVALTATATSRRRVA